MKNKLKITEEWSKAINLALKNKKSLYITGKPGTGKSEFLKYIRRITNKKLAVVAPTGIAALNVKGVTIHSFFRLNFKPFNNLDKNHVFKINKNQKQLIRALDIIIIDEISMVRADMIDNIDYILRRVGNSKKYFGGIKMIFIGDMYQLPPVISNDLKLFYKEHYHSPYFFDSHVFTSGNFKYNQIEFTQIFRQTDEKFKKILNRIRLNTYSQTDLDIINERVYKRLPSNKKTVLLATTNQIVNKVNNEKLNKIDSPAFFFKTEYEKDSSNNLPTGYKKFNDLLIKVGAQVMMTVNSSDGWVNGSTGVVKKIDKLGKFLIITIKGIDYTVYKYEWKDVKYKFDKSSEKIEEIPNGKIIQFPVKLGWAVTIHKSQGQTIDNAIIDIGNGAFAAGQLYTALSRVRTLDSFYLKRPIKKSDILIDQRIINFENSFKD